jgi:hypothetical protein
MGFGVAVAAHVVWVWVSGLGFWCGRHRVRLLSCKKLGTCCARVLENAFIECVHHTVLSDL